MNQVPVNFLVEKHGYGEDIQHLIDAIEAKGMRVSCPKYVPFEGGEYNQFPNEACVAFFGSLNLGRHITRTKPWVPGPFCKLEYYKCSTYYAYWGDYLWNQRYVMLPYAEFKRQIFSAVAMLTGRSKVGRTSKWTIFIRPDDGFKSFTGQTIGNANYKKTFEELDSQIKPDTLVIASSFRRPEKEWRLFCEGTTILSGSQYKNNGQEEMIAGIPQEVRDYAEYVLAHIKWFPEWLFVMDIGKEANTNLANQYGVIELNSFSCSGLYKCDVNPIVDAAIREARKEYNDINSINKKEP